MPARSDTTRVVIDNGGYTCKVGLAGQEAPARLMPNGLAKSKSEHKVFIADQLERANLHVINAASEMEAAIAERNAAQRELSQLGSRIRNDGLAARQRQAKDAARVQALTEQASQLQKRFPCCGSWYDTDPLSL